MAQQDAVIRLLLVEDQLEDAEQLISMLRNGGMAVRPQRPESEQDMEKILGSQVIDLVIAGFDAKYIAFAKASKLVEGTGKDIPILAASNSITDDIMLGAIAAGARDVVL